jgi:hypothetical protein
MGTVYLTEDSVEEEPIANQVKTSGNQYEIRQN